MATPLPPQKGSVSAGRITIGYDLSRSQWKTVLSTDITVGGGPILTALQAALAPGIAPINNAPLRTLLTDLFEGVSALDAALPKNTLAFRDAADRVFEETVSGLWRGLLDQNRPDAALELVMWSLDVCRAWERQSPTRARYIHKGAPYY